MCRNLKLYSGTWPSYLTDLLSLRLVGAIGARINLPTIVQIAILRLDYLGEGEGSPGKPREAQGNPGKPRVPHSLHNRLRIILMHSGSNPLV